MATPFYLYSLFVGRLSFGDFLLYETTLYNFVVANNGMWYIAASLLMYLISPFISRLMGQYEWRALIVGLIFTFGFVAISIAIHTYAFEYSLHTSVLYNQLAIFVVGMTFGFLTLRSHLDGIWFCFFILFVAFALLKDKYNYIDVYYPQMKEILSILTISSFLHYTRKKGGIVLLIEKVIAWFGRYSLELYVMHMLLIGTVKDIMYNIACFSSDIMRDRFAVLIMLVFTLTICVPIHKVTTKICKVILKNNILSQ